MYFLLSANEFNWLRLASKDESYLRQNKLLGFQKEMNNFFVEGRRSIADVALTCKNRVPIQMTILFSNSKSFEWCSFFNILPLCSVSIGSQLIQPSLPNFCNFDGARSYIK
jgi:hypothetical protein